MRRRPLTDKGKQIPLHEVQPTNLLFSFFFLFEQFSFVRHHAPTAGQIEVRFSKHVISYLSGVTPALVGPFPTFVSTVQHHGGSSPRSFWHVWLGRLESPAIFRLFFQE
jgi:hypothetical protein